MIAPVVPELSIIIPAYNEEHRLPRGLTKIRDYLASRNLASTQVEIIVVDDGSQDRTVAVTQEWSREFPSLRLISNERNRGKGYSVRRGMLEARGRIALFTDADLSAPIEEADKLLAAIAAGNDLAIGSRAIVSSGSSPACRFTTPSAASKRLCASGRTSSSSNNASRDSGLILKFYFSRSVTAFVPRKFPYAGRTIRPPKST
jgi:glycosyltransferase involved in cell wall biosynthesis